jgi:hypothetical protein
MSFLKDVLGEFTGHHTNRDQPPPVYYPWIVEWDDRDNRWLFINQQTGERTFNYPGQGGGRGGMGSKEGMGVEVMGAGSTTKKGGKRKRATA